LPFLQEKSVPLLSAFDKQCGSHKSALPVVAHQERNGAANHACAKKVTGSDIRKKTQTEVEQGKLSHRKNG